MALGERGRERERAAAVKAALLAQLARAVALALPAP